jgi:hypothetical protein
VTHVEYIRSVMDRILETFEMKDESYGSSWLNDGLDFRSPFIEVVTKIQRLKKLLWEDFQEVEFVGPRSRAVETIDDTILYLLLTRRKLELEKGDADPELLKKIRDKG